MLAQALAEALPAARTAKEIPLVTVEVDPETVAKVVADWTGIPVGKMVRDDVAATASIEDRLMKRGFADKMQRFVRLRDDSAMPKQGCKIRDNRLACSCSSGRAVRARPKRRCRWPTCCSVASASWSRSTCQSFRKAHGLAAHRITARLCGLR